MRSDPRLSGFIESSSSQFRVYKKLADGALEQIDDASLFEKFSPESNSIPVLIQHVSGNLRSRWTDFLTADGEKEWRDRAGELEEKHVSREELLAAWESGWDILFKSLGALSPAHLERTVTIRGEKLSVIQAIQRSLTHTAYHVGQIVYLCKAMADSEWRSLSIPRSSKLSTSSS